MFSKFLKAAALILILVAGVWFFYGKSHKPETAKSISKPIEEIARHQLELTEKGLVYKDTKRLFTGKALEYHPEGNRKVSISISSGKVHGTTEAWHENGQIESTEDFKSGLSEGARTRWYDNGQKKSETTTKAGKIHGKYTKWYQSGQIAQQATIIDGEAHGESKSWYEDGTLKAFVILDHGKVVDAKYYDTSGALKK